MTELPTSVVGLIGTVDAMLAELTLINGEIGHRLVASSPDYECGLIRFVPRSAPGDAAEIQQIVHANQDLICWIVRGSGRLTLDNKVQQLAVGDICRIPAGQPHDFAARGRPLILLYAKMRVAP